MRCSSVREGGGEGRMAERSGIRGDISSVVERERRAVGRRESAIRKRHEKLARDRKLCVENARARVTGGVGEGNDWEWWRGPGERERDESRDR